MDFHNLQPPDSASGFFFFFLLLSWIGLSTSREAMCVNMELTGLSRKSEISIFKTNPAVKSRAQR